MLFRSAELISGNESININTTYIVVASYDQNTATVSLYKNGIILNSHTSLASPVRSAPFTSVPAVIGDTPFVGVVIPTKLNGILDELIIYDRALSAKEVCEHYLPNLSTKCD